MSAPDSDIRLSFTHNQFYRGYWTRGEVISHFIGTEGQDYFARVTNRLTPNLMLGLELNRAVIGSTVSGFTGPKERRVGGGIDLSRNFRRGDDSLDQLFRIPSLSPEAGERMKGEGGISVLYSA